MPDKPQPERSRQTTPIPLVRAKDAKAMKLTAQDYVDIQQLTARLLARARHRGQQRLRVRGPLRRRRRRVRPMDRARTDRGHSQVWSASARRARLCSSLCDEPPDRADTGRRHRQAIRHRDRPPEGRQAEHDLPGRPVSGRVCEDGAGLAVPDADGIPIEVRGRGAARLTSITLMRRRRPAADHCPCRTPGYLKIR